MRALVIVLITFAIYAKVNALKCYVCDSALHGPSCYEPLDESNVKALDCKDVYKYQRHIGSSNSEGDTFDFKQPQKLQGWNPNMNPNWNPNTIPNWNPNVYSQPTEFECVQYEQLYCTSKVCSCKKKNMPCIGACYCMGQKSCRNSTTSKRSRKLSTVFPEDVMFVYNNTSDNRRLYVRRCQGKNQSPNFCREMENFGNFQGFKLTKCNVCYSDYCNKSGNIKLSLLLNFAFFLIFYRCTDF